MNKQIEEGDLCISGGTNELYYKEIKKKIVRWEKVITRSILNKFHSSKKIRL